MSAARLGLLASADNREGFPSIQTGSASEDGRQSKGPQDTPAEDGNTSEDGGSLQPFQYHGQWGYRFEGDYQGKGWTGINTPPPGGGLLGDGVTRREIQ